MNNPLDQFRIIELSSFKLADLHVQFTNSAFLMLVAVLCFGIFVFCAYFIASNKNSIIPNRLQIIAELLHTKIESMVLETTLGTGKKYIPLILTIFLFILICNVIGIIPGSFTVTSHISITFCIAICLFILFTTIGFIKHGLNYFSLFCPSGTPIYIAPLLFIVEFFAYLARPVSLSLRLAANMTAGHIVLKVIASLCTLSGILALFPFALLTVLTAFEIFIAALQAYIFTILSCVYLNDALNLH